MQEGFVAVIKDCLIAIFTIVFISTGLYFIFDKDRKPDYTLNHQCLYAYPVDTCSECYRTTEGKSQPTCLSIVTPGQHILGTLCLLTCNGPKDVK